jgi:fumarate hydratase class I
MEVETIRLKTPLKEEDIRKLEVGQRVLLSGYIITGRDRIHKYLFEERPSKDEIPFMIKGGVLYHCGPIIEKTDKGYRFIVGGPTTSSRMEPYEWFVIKEYGLRGIIGKGGMGQKSLEAMGEAGCVYFHTISGAAAYLADRVVEVKGVWKEEFGLPEAMWYLYVEDFPLIVTMDANGRSLHEEIKKASYSRLKELFEE